MTPEEIYKAVEKKMAEYDGDSEFGEGVSLTLSALREVLGVKE